MGVSELKRELQTIDIPTLGAAFGMVTIESMDMDAALEQVDGLYSEYPALDYLGTMMTAYAEMVGVDKRESDLLVSGTLTSCLTLTRPELSATLRRELKVIDKEALASAFSDMIAKQLDMSKAIELVGSLEREYPALAFLGRVMEVHAVKLGASVFEMVDLVQGALSPGMSLKQLIDTSELDSTPAE